MPYLGMGVKVARMALTRCRSTAAPCARFLGARRVEYYLIVTGFRARLSRLFHDDVLLIGLVARLHPHHFCG